MNAWFFQNWRQIVLIVALLVGAAIVWGNFDRWEGREFLPTYRVEVPRPATVSGIETCPTGAGDCKRVGGDVVVPAGVYDDPKSSWHPNVVCPGDCPHFARFLLLNIGGRDIEIEEAGLKQRGAKISQYPPGAWRFTPLGWVLLGAIVGLLAYALVLAHRLLMAQPAAPPAPAAPAAPPPAPGGPNP